MLAALHGCIIANYKNNGIISLFIFKLPSICLTLVPGCTVIKFWYLVPSNFMLTCNLVCPQPMPQPSLVDDGYQFFIKFGLIEFIKMPFGLRNAQNTSIL